MKKNSLYIYRRNYVRLYMWHVLVLPSLVENLYGDTLDAS